MGMVRFEHIDNNMRKRKLVSSESHSHENSQVSVFSVLFTTSKISTSKTYCIAYFYLQNVLIRLSHLI